MALHLKPFLLDQCYKYAINQEIALFYGLEESVVINMIYMDLERVISLSENEFTIRGNEIANLYLDTVALAVSGLYQRSLDREVMTKISGKEFVARVIERSSKAESSWMDYAKDVGFHSPS